LAVISNFLKLGIAEEEEVEPHLGLGHLKVAATNAGAGKAQGIEKMVAGSHARENGARPVTPFGAQSTRRRRRPLQKLVQQRHKGGERWLRGAVKAMNMKEEWTESFWRGPA